MKVAREATTSQGENWQLLPKTLSSSSSKKYVIIKSWQQSFSSSLMKKILKKIKGESGHNKQFGFMDILWILFSKNNGELKICLSLLITKALAV